MERWSESQIEPPPDWDDEPTFKVVILYEDGPTGGFTNPEVVKAFQLRCILINSRRICNLVFGVVRHIAFPYNQCGSNSRNSHKGAHTFYILHLHAHTVL